MNTAAAAKFVPHMRLRAGTGVGFTLRKGSFLFSDRWTEAIRQLPETGMGYTVVSVTLKDGRKFHQVIIDSGRLNRIRGLMNVPFDESDIAEIEATHAKWDWREDP